MRVQAGRWQAAARLLQNQWQANDLEGLSRTLSHSHHHNRVRLLPTHLMICYILG
ncbi:hypothetical protein B0T17DRAFT_525236 [Bombardia bombarda]|uniref:Uncharacterized protein n=1 Tax=Bombardia bombarda TaxID=252184 RepID=A0AA40C992_9PEZI|nr:hypothetical protein B0T17DRAFT_525236 [Bombardia bombarda]